MNKNRETYIDNNGFLRYEDNCKLVMDAKDNKEALNEMHRIFTKKIILNSNKYDYEELILQKQGEYL